MKIANAKNQEVLDTYFKELLEKNQPIPYIDGVREATGVSVSTISRYARRIGFYSYSDLRVNYTKQVEALTGIHGNVSKFLTFLKEHERFVIITSLNTRAVGEFLLDRMKAMQMDVLIAKDSLYINDNRATIILTVNGESLRTLGFLKTTNQNSGRIIITCLKTLSKDTVSLSRYMYKEKTIIDLFKSLRLMNEWIQNAIDAFEHIEDNQEKTKKKEVA